ncbi:MAG: HD family phosphohydrolase [Chloroflexota bacterium]
MSLERLESWIRRLAGGRPLPGPRMWRVASAAVLFVVMSLVFSTGLVPERVSLQAGEVAPRDVIAPETIIDQARTAELQQQRAETVPAVYTEDPSVITAVERDTRGLFEKATIIATDTSLNVSDKISRMKTELTTPVPLSDATLQTLARSNADTLVNLSDSTVDVLRRVLANGIKPEGIEQAWLTVSAQAGQLPYSESQRLAVTDVGRAMLRPNMLLNREQTEIARRQAMATVEPVKIPKGAIIVRKGDVVTAEQITTLESIGLQRRGGDFRSIFGVAFLSLLLISGGALFLAKFHRDVLEREGQVAMLCLIITITLILIKLPLGVSGYLALAAAGTMLITVLIDARVAMVAGLIFATGAGLLSGYDLRVAFVALIGGLTGIYGVTYVDQRSDLMRAGFAVSVANALTIFTLGLLARMSIADIAIWRDVMWGILNGLICFVITIGLLTPFENMFDIITPVKLLELSNPNQPLLRKLLTEAPGSYHHSIIVGNLAEAATREVGGNALLARVGAYYHDIGKIKRPYFFIENQMGEENPHDKLSPHLSALIIMSHIRDGVDMAREAGLPRQVVDIVQQHHGTTLISYFFRRATEDNPAGKVEEADFRHEGPRPQSKEAAVVMLADAIEAAVRSLTDPTPQRIDGMIKKIIRDRLEDGQLDNCDLTLRDLDRIGQSFLTVLSGIFHPRIEYPESVIRQMKESLGQNAGTDEQRAGQGPGH